jgi:hypothetical protein
MAMASDKVDAEVIDAEEFGDLAKRFGVGPVPMTVINGSSQFPGAAPEAFVLQKVLAAQ